MRVMLLIPALHHGGAERQIIQLVRNLDKTRFSVTLVTFHDGGELRSEAESIEGLKVLSLRKQPGWKNILSFLYRLWRVTRSVAPKIMVGYMNLASNLALLAGWAAHAKVVWSLRASDIDYSRYYRTADWVFQLGAALSRFPDLVILNSKAGKQYHVSRGYCEGRMVVIPNGIDTDQYQPMYEAGRSLRIRWGITDDETLIGIVGRLDIIKNHRIFIQAAADLSQDRTDLRFVVIGNGPAEYKAELEAFGQSLGLGNRLIWVGSLNNMPAVYSALDLLASTSSSEGFPNVVGEAMACGVPCIVTDVGDSALIVGNTGDVIPYGDTYALTQVLRRWLLLPKSERRAKGLQARAKVEREFNLQTMVIRTQTVLQNLCAADRQ